MSQRLKLEVKALNAIAAGDLVILVSDRLAPPKVAEDWIGAGAHALIARAAAAERFKGKALSGLTLLAPEDAGYERLILVGTGPESERDKLDFAALGGAIAGRLGHGRSADIIAALLEGELAASEIAEIGLGLRLRSYAFDRYKTKSRDKDQSEPKTVTIRAQDPAAVKKALKAREAIAGGVELARDLVNEPPNVLFPEEFAERAGKLDKLGVEVEILDEKELKKIGMRALLGVGQGSHRESRVVVMRWNGGAKGDKPVAFVGKGVTFDTGGISIKPAGGMEDMKGDMAGAACVTGLMQALSQRKAKVNAVGVIGLVENMPDGKAQRPGDIVTSLSGQTIEIINTDAEGRLVLADVLWYTQERFKPVFMVNLATLTGAILVALAQENAGLFSNNDELSERLFAAGKATGETVWRMPLSAAYDKMIDSKFADMKNSAGRHGGSITAAQFLQRHVNDTPWAHLDIAGTGMGSPNSETNRSWGSGWGVRLLDRLVADHYES
ncbi:putative cytosol aminopeptidase [Bosea sp. 62]|uniref:leucyl aminopeptidase n=1 Tax=unclassified Bosea (in: a-proteobacteria) TaxID=2653178 RepID=UPI0012537DC7|nr:MULTISPECIES: leucyl aminopeptidase [unclassified Bosea (in: a-proteobacteria)]CAD5257760.1 putative cytosol aminopeptidase [Bosea sp. 46]CAD5262158.1 putative cytosol aminopeptidase [Bosea sp. 21B]CAD5278340.1 putative cytosol aminopeptidase [Bosea sp. 7B]VVT58657.1 putative cytosol aminopeptidase [Bosea sp. EC-HK365B]VXB58146.1 putative cytosol aminopeptidase [Bosea sp. 29B]